MIKEKIRMELGKRNPIHAEGFVRIDLTDPISGKTKKRVEGKNMVFPESLFSSYGSTWQERVSNTLMCMNDDATAPTLAFPYLRGQTIAYGRPSLGTLGTFRGAYNAANQILAEQSMTKTRWKFQYDFTTAQGNSGTMRNVGLTTQYLTSYQSSPNKRFKTLGDYTHGYYTSDGRYNYSCSGSGIISKYDPFFNTTTTIDVSAIVGTIQNNYKSVAYAPNTGKGYIYIYSATPANRRMYVFSDMTFSTLENTYSPTILISNTSGYSSYVYGNYLYYTPDGSNLYKADFVNNIAVVMINTSAYNNASYTESNYAQNNGAIYNSCPIPGTSYVLFGNQYSGSACKSFVFNLANDTIIAFTVGITSSYYSTALDILNTEKMFLNIVSPTPLHNAAISTYILPEPVTKTEANGMTATYELEVYW
ncbi:MAG: hypothetical protein NC238_03045 [Dehalobacter sp.]|nr:hypothetical protein [Dehalobacter sp.]